MQVGNPPHRKPWQIRDQHTFVTSYCNRHCAYRCGLIHHEQDLPVCFEVAYQCSEFHLVIGQSAVQQAFALAIAGYGMMRSFAYVDTDKDLDAVMLFNISHAFS